MNRIITNLLISIVALALVPNTVGARDSVVEKIQQGIEHLYNVRFDDASKSFDAVIAAAPNDPRGYFYRANVHLWSYLFDRRQDQLALFTQYSDKAISVANRSLSANSSNADAKLFLGMSYGYKAIANARAENFMAAAVSARTCYTKLNELASGSTKSYDAYLGLGIFHFVFGSVPKIGQFMAGMGGIKGDAQLGLREIETAARKGNYFKTDAELIFALLNIYYRQNFELGLKSLNTLSKRYPRNVALLYSLGAVYLDRGESAKAIQFFDQVISQANNDFRTFTTMSYGRGGMVYFSRNDFARARTYLQKFLRLSQEKSYRAYGWYLLGLCYEVEGNRTNAVKAYERCVASPNYATSEDRLAHRKARVLIKKAMTATDISVLRALNAASTQDFSQTLSLTRALTVQSGITPAQSAQSFYALGQALQGKADYKGAIEAFTKATRSGIHPETWVAPYSYFHIAECQLKLGNKDAWQENIDRAKDFSGYDNEPLLRFKIERDVTLID